MRREILQLAAELAKGGEPYVLATVVRREPPSSAQTGDMAVIKADGSYHGWLGGSCTQPTVKREARAALLDGKSRLIALSTDPKKQERPGVTAMVMTCHSGGAVDIFLEPVLPVPRLVIFGVSPVARALAQLSKAMGYSVDIADPAIEEGAMHADRFFTNIHAPELRSSSPAASSGLSALVATMGESDEDAVAAALAIQPAYLGVIASRKRFALIREMLIDRGIAAGALDRIKNPAGLDIGAKSPEEQALSVLAEMVQLRRAHGAAMEAVQGAIHAAPQAHPALAASEDAEAIDLICGMSVVIKGARHLTTHAGRAFYFCNPRCKEKFIADPGRYLAQAVAETAAAVKGASK